MRLKRLVLSTVAAAALTLGALTTAMADDGGHKKDPHKDPHKGGGVTLVAPVSLAANLCDINVNVLSHQVDRGNTTCVAVAESSASAHGGKADHKGRGGDVTVIIPVAVALNLCDINVNVLSRQVDRGNTTCVAIAQADASADGGKMVRHGGKKRSGQTGSLTVLVPVSIAANICDINVNVLSRQATSGDTTCVAVAESSASAHASGSAHGGKVGHKDKKHAVTVLIPVSIAKNVCDVNVNFKSRQVDKGDTTCIAIAEADASMDGGKVDKHGKDKKDARHDRKRVHVQVHDKTVKLPAAWAANVCDVNVNILSTQLESGDVMCVAVASSRA